MTRRDLLAAWGAAGAASLLPPRLLNLADMGSGQSMEMGAGAPLALFVYPGFAALDLIGPNSYLAMHGNVQIVAKTRSVVVSDDGIPVSPTMTFEECPRDLDLLLVPGGMRGTAAVLEDEVSLRFIATRGPHSKRLVSVCTGALILGAAGQLKGKKATTHWSVHDLLPLYGATPVQQRYVKDGHVWTGAGVTAGLDLGLALVAEMYGSEHAKMMELAQEYDPAPPFNSGSPKRASRKAVAQVMEHTKPLIEAVNRTRLVRH